MNFDAALVHVTGSLRKGADLRIKVAKDCGAAIVQCASLVANCFNSNGKLFLFGNGGSAADAQHLAAEFVGRFICERRALPAIALTTDSSILTAIGNDYGFERVFARQIEALGRKGDVAIGISTSGNSPNVLAGLRQARQQELHTVGLAGNDGGALAASVDVAIIVKTESTAHAQECHIAIGHLICELVENEISQQARD